MSVLSGAENILRYASSGHVDGGVVGGTAFILKPKDEGLLSVNRPAIFSPDVNTAIAEICVRARLTIRKTGRFAELNVDNLLDKLTEIEELSELSVIEDPLPAEDGFLEDPSHAGILGLPVDGVAAELVGDLIAQCVTQVYSPPQ